MVDRGRHSTCVDRAGEAVVVGRARAAGLWSGGEHEHERGEQHGGRVDDACKWGVGFDDGGDADERRGQLVDGERRRYGEHEHRREYELRGDDGWRHGEHGCWREHEYRYE